MSKNFFTFDNLVQNIDILNFIIAVLALLIAIYSVHYTRKFNRRKLFIPVGASIANQGEGVMHWFEVCNVSPSPITITGIEFSDMTENSIQPTHHKPVQTYTYSGPFTSRIPDILDSRLYENLLEPPFVLNPYESEEFGYYFDRRYRQLIVTVHCKETIQHLRKTQSFVVHFNEDDE